MNLGECVWRGGGVFVLKTLVQRLGLLTFLNAFD